MAAQDESKEEFCSVCVSGLAALAGMGTSGASGSVKNKKAKKIIFWVGVSITVISIMVLIYLLTRKDCNACSSSA